MATAAARRLAPTEREQQALSPKAAAATPMAQAGSSHFAGGGAPIAGASSITREARMSTRLSRLTSSRRITAGSSVAASEWGRQTMRGSAAQRAAMEQELYDDEGNRVTPRSLLPKSQQEGAGLGGEGAMRLQLMHLPRDKRTSTNSNASYASSSYQVPRRAFGGGAAADNGRGPELSDQSTNDASRRASRLSSTASMSMMSVGSSNDDGEGGEQGTQPSGFQWPDEAGKVLKEKGDQQQEHKEDDDEGDDEDNDEDNGGPASVKQIQQDDSHSKEAAGESAPSLSESELDAQVVVALSETETMWLLEIPSRCISNEDTEMVAAVTAENSAHEAAKLRQQEATELFMDAYVQTANYVLKCKETSLSIPQRSTCGCLANNWTIHQALNEQKNSVPDADEVVNARNAVEDRAASGGGDDDDTKSAAIARSSARDNRSNAPAALINDTRLTNLLQLCECVLLQNQYYAKLVSFKAIIVPPRLWEFIGDAYECGPQKHGEGESSSEDLQWLWAFDACSYNASADSNIASDSANGDVSLGNNSSVTALAWSNQAAGVAAVGFSSGKSGAIAIMSLRSPNFPVRVISRPAPVTALGFCHTKPHLLAAGGGDGVVAVFDLSKKEDASQLLVESTTATGKHSDPVYQVHWVNPTLGGVGGSVNGAGSFVSISTDGRVTIWSLSKGLEHMDLIQLATPTMNRGSSNDSSTQEGLVSRLSGGMCLDFSPRDPSAYLAGTEDGWVHLCSAGYSEQYLESVRAHNGPVYRVAYSPFCSPSESSSLSSSSNSNGYTASGTSSSASAPAGISGDRRPIFLSASADWTVKLWRQGRRVPIFSCQPAACAVNDCAWSPTSATSFAAVTEDGKLQLWDISYSTVNPKSEWKVPVDQSKAPEALTRVLFSSEYPILIVGSSLGRVHIFRLNVVGDRSKPLDAATEIDKLEHFTKTAAVSVV